MKAARAHTAVLLFTRTSTEEARAKKFTPSTRRNKAIIRQLINRTKLLVQQAGLPLIVIDSTKQKGETFGERLQHAIQQVVNAGYEQVICLGNDSPGLTPGLLRLAAAKLQHQDFVFGEAADGGVYLIGLRQPTQFKLNFTTIPWQTAQVFQELCRQTTLFRVTILEPILADADNTAAILAISNTCTTSRFLIILRSLLQLCKATAVSFTPLLVAARISTPGLRAPPRGM
ncbi:TIGR04282 family arsenosugar biosynthesis glycosyltransferase [Adhaeribacter radiodurans]|uniref:DUF2064 domain-containing protein n=1 Tax=Adhaeribacter radiodurans TaxID=2745197 RepID=A0A7L7LAT8_9BACT|nr:DUF2064 domain-containing protein [Adhaeribacter radiodurans]QMU29940.1 DUF2064 domain-containing protein [Adhaeribacter radiodurans]